MGTNEYAYVYDLIGDQKSAKPKAQPPGDRDYKAARRRGARSGIPRRSGNCYRTAATNDGVAAAYAANALNQYTNLQSTAYSLQPSYDPDGNMLTNGPWAYTWDAENRMVSACSNNVLLVTNVYDHLSRRIRKEVYVLDSGSWILASDSSFLYDGWNVVREVRGQSSEVSTNYYTWGLDLSGTMQGAGGVGGLLAVTTVSSQSAQPATFYPCYDANGNVTAYLDDSGMTAASFEYDSFGNAISEPVAAGVHLPYRFSTKYLDPETGLYYYGYRFYHPELGRWVNRDPIGERGGMNVFLFALNQPTRFTDLCGLLVAPYVIYNTHDYTDRAYVEKPESWWNSPENRYLDLVAGGKADGETVYSWSTATVVGECKCEETKEEIKKGAKRIAGAFFTVTFDHTFYVRSHLDPYAKWDQPYSLEGVVGHEQRHVKAMRKLLEHKITKLYLKPIDADTIDACNQKAAVMALRAQSKLRDLLHSPGDTHVDQHPGDPAYADEPITGKPYPYL